MPSSRAHKSGATAELIKAAVDILSDDVAQALILADRRNTVRHINDRACHLLRVTKRQAIGRGLSKLCPKHVEPIVRRLIEDLRRDAGKRTVSAEVTIARQPLVLHLRAIRDPDGSYRGVLASDTQPTKLVQPAADTPDGTKRQVENKKAKAQQTEAHLRLLLPAIEQSTEGIAVGDLQGNLLFTNEAFAGMHGYTSRELVGRHFSILHTPDQMPSVEAANREILQTGEFCGEIWHVRRNGTVFPSTMHNSLVRDEAGHPLGIVGTMRDITEPKRADNLMRAQRDLSLALSAAPTLDEALRLCVDAALEVSGMDCAGVYLIDDRSDALDLAFHKGLPPGFVSGASHYDAESRNARIVRAGKPIYTHYQGSGLDRSEAERLEGLRAIAVVPVHHQGKVIGCLNIASHGLEHVPVFARDALETIAAQIGSLIAHSKAQEALQDSEQTARALLNAPTDTVTLLDTNGTVLDTNEAMARRLGKQRAELIGSCVWDLFPAQVAERRRAFVDKVIRSGRPVRFEDERQGTWNDSVVYPLLDDQGNVTRIAVVARDITERKQAEERLRESQRALSTLMSNMPGMAYRCRNDRDWTMEFVSEGCFELTGYQADDVIHNRKVSYAHLIHPEDRDAVWNDVQAALQANRPFRLVYRITTATGQEKWVWEQGCGVFSPNGALIALEGFITDVTERRRAEEAIRRSEEMLRLVVEGTPQHFFYVQQRDGTFQYISPSIEQVTGRSPEEWQRDFPACLTEHPMNEQFHKGRRKVLRGQTDSAGCTVEIRHQTGRHMWLQVHERALTENGKIVGIQGVASDITERKIMQDHLFAAQKMESVGRLAGGVAHDLNNMMVAVLGLTSLMKSRRTPDDEEYEYLEYVSRSAESASDLAKQLLAFAHGGKHQLRRVRLNEVIGHSLRIVRRAAPSLRIVERMTPALWDIDADPTQMQQVIINLCENAAEAMPGGGRLTITTRNLRVSKVGDRPHHALPPGRYVHLCVEDEGCGMDEATVRRLFEPFFTTKADGRGMGLAAVYGIIKNHGGHVFVETEPGAGTTFRVYFPAAATTDT